MRSIRHLLSYETPFETDDRGLYFDGIYDSLEISGLHIALQGTFAFWLFPKGAGTVLSQTTEENHVKSKVYSLMFDSA
jgi:hypothetical protein